jgi:hypothetical protein
MPKVTRVNVCFSTISVRRANGIRFDDGSTLEDFHDSECCEHHYLDFSAISLEDFDGLEFDLSSEDFFERVPDYGIRLVPTNGHPVSIPGYGYNNGYYSSNLSLILTTPDGKKTFDISECQEWKD